MTRYLLILILPWLLVSQAHAQSVLLFEDFENTTALAFTSSGFPGWAVTTQLYSSGLRSDSSSCLNPGDSSVLTSSGAFSTSGYGFVMLEFDHICKVEFYDAGYVEVSADNGLTWARLTGAQYLGAGQFASSGNKFNSTSYLDWLPGNPSPPQNSWWKHEYFDISALAANVAQVRIRFILQDENNQSVFDNYGWFLDNVKVTAALSELTPPSISLVPPVLQGLKFSLGPFPIQASITDTSGIDTAWVVFRVNHGSWDSIPMQQGTGNIFQASIPPVNDLDTIDYFVSAVDNSLSHNTGNYPGTGYITVVASSGLYTPYSIDFELPDSLWLPSPPSSNTAWQYGYPNYGLLVGAHSGSNAWTVNKDSLYGNNTSVFLTSPYFNFAQATDLVLSFWQNRNTESSWDGMYVEYTLDELNWFVLGDLNDPSGDNWYTDTIYATGGGPAWEGSSGGWVKSSYRLDSLNNVPMVRFRFVFSSDPYVTYEGVSIDDFSIRPRPAKDVAVKKVLSPGSGCQLGLQPVSALVRNEGKDTLFTFPMYYQVQGSSVPVSELFSDTLLPDSSITFVFNTLLNMQVSGMDSLFEITVYSGLQGDSIHDNDTAFRQVISGSIPADPVPGHTTIPYATSTIVTAQSPDTLFWYADPAAIIPLHIGDSLQTPVLYDTAIYWVEARAGIGDLRFTELTYESTGAGSTNPYPSYIPPSTLWDGIEITNVGASAINLDGFIFHMEGYKVIDYILPSGVQLLPGELIVLSIYSYPLIPADSANRFYIAGNQAIYSTSQLGFWLEAPDGSVEDAFAVNGYSFSAGSQVTPADWSGTIPSGSATAGVIRVFSDSNQASDWVLSGLPTPVQTIGSYNPQLGPVISLGCSGNRVPLFVYIASFPPFDAGVVSILEPVSSASLTAAEPVKVVVKNFGLQQVNGFNLSFSLDGGAPVTEPFSLAIPPGDTAHCTFTASVDLSAFQVYNLKVWVTSTGDTVPVNDTITANVTHMLPAFCASSALYTSLADIGEVVFGPLTNISSTGMKTYTDYSYLTPESYIQGISYPISVTMLSQSSYNYIFGIKVFIDLNGNGTFDSATETVLSGLTTSTQTTVAGNYTIPYGSVSGLVKMRVVMMYTSNIANVQPCGTYSYGETEDYTILLQPPLAFDASARSLQALTPPLIESSQVQLRVWVKNVGSDSLQQIPVGWMISGQSPVTGLVPSLLLPGDSILYTFPTQLTIPLGVFTLKVFTDLPNDGYRVNDTLQFTLLGEKDFTAFFFDDFEHDDNNGWTSEMSSFWQLGKPSALVINTAHSPTRAWATRLSGNYLHNIQKGVITPEFNFTSMTGLSLRFWHWYETEYGFDGGNVKYSVNGGTTFITLGYINDPLGVNWYNANASGKFSFSGSSGKWVYSSYDLSSAFDNSPDPVSFKFDFFSNNTIAYNGWAIDDFMISVEKDSIDAGVTGILLPVLTVPQGQSFSVMVRIQNFGKTALTSIPLAFTVNGGMEVQDTWTGLLQPGFTVTYILSNTAVSPGYMELKAYTKVPGDNYLFNNAASKVVGHIGVYSVDPGVDLQVFPNPAHGRVLLKISSDNESDGLFTLVDVMGKIVKTGTLQLQAGETLEELMLQDLAPGVYNMVITIGKKRCNARIILK